MIEDNFYSNLESNYKVTYPEQEGATYTSLLNFSDEGNKFRQRWYRYKEGYSVDLIKILINEYNKNANGIILDPFLGSGTTVMAANELGLKGIGFEVNPFSYFLSKCKLTNYTDSEKMEFKTAAVDTLIEAEKLSEKKVILLPKLSIAEKVFNPNIQNYFMAIKEVIDRYNGSENVKNLLLLGWLASLETISQYRKAGNGLKKKSLSKNKIDNILLVTEIIKGNYDNIYNDITGNTLKFNAELINDSSLNLSSYIDKESISGVIFSPPYANSFDYTEIYKLELWFGSFVKEYSDLKKLREISFRSHLNGLSSKTDISKLDLKTIPELDTLINVLQTKELWDKKIPIMLKMYFSEMFELLDRIWESLECDGFCSIVVGNSAYGGIIFPTDLLIAKYAETIGFTVDKIEVDRYIITSSQQYHITLNTKKYLRESVICLVKSKK
ncbi:modification methylase [Vagococcus humatus]|uniref:Modification methylase n=1 Tax=Vagococcus humatus TaxID=1889241 RepID=A0A3R9YEM7_9ENTE|nr:modification methylase [Vagococcus humatus]